MTDQAASEDVIAGTVSGDSVICTHPCCFGHHHLRIPQQLQRDIQRQAHSEEMSNTSFINVSAMTRTIILQLILKM